MGRLSDVLRDMEFSPTGRESPVSEDGELWTNGHETVCDETGIIIDGNHHAEENGDGESHVYRYRNSGRVKLPGGHVSSYEWGEDEEKGEFYY